MSRVWRIDEPPRQIRVHGVGGPQATRMLGLLHDEDTVPVPNAHLPEAAQSSSATRFVRGVPDDGVEAYEWGALTTGSWAKGLWVLYLPLTLINAAGWAHPAGGPGGASPRGPAPYRWAAHAVALLATVTYVVWTAYIVLDLVATRWVDHVTCQGPDAPPGCRPEVTGIAGDAAGVWVPIAAPVVFLALVGAVFGAPVLRSRRPTAPTEAATGDNPAPPTRRGPPEHISDPDFFAQGEGALRTVHTVVVGVVALGAVVLHLAGWDRLGLLVIVTAVAQTFALVVMGLSDLVARARWRWYEVSGVAALPPGLWEPRRALPVGVALAAVGTALTHSAFSGAAHLLRGFLADRPGPSPVSAITAHAELGAADVLGGMLALAAVGALLTLGHVVDRPPEEQSPPIVALARRAHLLGTWLLVAVAVPVGIYAVLNRTSFWPQGSTWPDPTWAHLEAWYDGYSPDHSSLLTSIGSAVVTVLPVAAFAVLRGSHRTGLGRVLGNVWDVLTFWPRRFHPFAVPAASERAVPELRARIVQAAAGRDPESPLVVAAHSQGSVLAVAALAGIQGPPPAVRLVTFGSPLGTLYAPTWPAYVPPALAAARAHLGATGEPWVNFSRRTDPIGAGVPHARNVVLDDPREPTEEDLAEDVAGRRPIDRPRWGRPEGHSRYLSDPRVRLALVSATAPVPDPAEVGGPPPGPADDGGVLRWAHRGGAAERPGNTVAAMHHALGAEACATALELDVQLARTGDGSELVVVHDRVLERGGDGRGRVRRHTVDALVRVNPGHGWVDVASPGTASPYATAADDDVAFRLPRLTELLSAIPDVPLTIEIKGRGGAAAATALMTALAPHYGPEAPGRPRRGPVVVTSLRGRTVGRARSAVPEGFGADVVQVSPGAVATLWFLFAAALPGTPPIGSSYARIQVPDLRIGGVSLVSRRFLRKAHGRGMGVDVWTVDDPRRMARLLRLMEREPPPEGIRDGIMTDRPSLLADVAGVTGGSG